MKTIKSKIDSISTERSNETELLLHASKIIENELEKKEFNKKKDILIDTVSADRIERNNITDIDSNIDKSIMIANAC